MYDLVEIKCFCVYWFSCNPFSAAYIRLEGPLKGVLPCGATPPPQPKILDPPLSGHTVILEELFQLLF